MALQRVFPIIDVFIYLHCCKAGQAEPRNSNSIFDLLDKWVRYQMNGRANKWAKTSNMNLLRTHETTHGYSQPAFGQFSQWKSFMFISNANQSRLLASLLTDTSASQSTTSAGKKQTKKHMPIYFCFTLFNIRDEENVFLCNYLIYLDLEYIKAVGGTVKKKRNLQIREISAMFKELNTQ